MTDPNTTLRVLVVDDQEHVRGWVRTILNRASITQVTEAASGREALRLVTAPGAEFDLVLCDLRMPDGDGIELIRDLAKLRFPTAVAILSVEEERLIETAGLIGEERGLQMLGVFAKPLTTEKLDELLHQLRNGRTARPTPVAPPAIDLQQAFLERQLSMVYQPRIRVRDGAFMGVEALVRWNHPTLGQVQPDSFLPMVEASPDHAAALTAFVLDEALACAGRWKASGRELPMSVNLSARTLDDLTLPDQLESLCASYQVPPEWITLELTEQIVAHDGIKLLDVGARLRLKGFHLSVDDFGVGISGLQQLQRLPFSELKIDKQFIHGCAESLSKRAVVEATISLARTLKMTTVAEGVQSRPEWLLLEELGCDLVQGYFIARPMTEEGLEAWAMQWMLHQK